MGIRRVYFEGRSYVRPGARGVFKSKPTKRPPSLDLNTLILIGPADNGFDCNDTTLTDSERIMEFSSFEEAKQTLVSGTALDAIKVAFSPSRDSRFSSGPQLIKFLNISPNERASVALQNTGTGTHTVKAVIPGPEGNKLRIFIKNPDEISIGDSKEIITKKGLNVTDISLQYTGNGSTCALTLNSTGLNTVITGQSDGSQDLSLTWKDFPTLGELVNRINSETGYSATIKTQPDLLTSNLDHVLSPVNINSPAALTSTLWRQITFLENTGFVEVIEGTNQLPFFDMISFKYLSGGSTGVWTNQNYIDAMEFSKNVSGLYCNVCSSNTAIASYLADITQHLSSPDGRNERFSGAGASPTLSLDDRLTDCKALNSEYMVYGVMPIEAYKADGLTKETFDGWYLALLHNACKAATNPREAITYKDLNIVSAPGFSSLTESEIESIIEAGGLMVNAKPNNGPYKIEFAVTTYQQSNFVKNQASTMTTALAMVKTMRERLDERFLGEVPVDPEASDVSFTDEDIREFINDTLRDFVRLGWLTSNIYKNLPAFNEDFEIIRDGDIISFAIDGIITSALNYFLYVLNLERIRS